MPVDKIKDLEHLEESPATEPTKRKPLTLLIEEENQQILEQIAQSKRLRERLEENRKYLSKFKI